MSRLERDSVALEHLDPVDAASGGIAELSALVVEPSLDELLRVMAHLTSHRFRVTAAESFAQAKPILSSQPPAVLITALRLGAYNGLHLVLRAKAARPDIASLVTSPVNDVVLRADAEAMGATFVVTPVGEQDLIAAVLQTFFRRDATAPPVRPPFERRLHQRRAAAGSFGGERRSSERRRLWPGMTSSESAESSTQASAPGEAGRPTAGNGADSSARATNALGGGPTGSQKSRLTRRSL